MIVPSATKFFGYKSSSLNDFALDTRVLTLSYKYKHWILNKFDWADFRTAPKLKYLKPAVPFSFFPPLLPSPLPPNRSKVSFQSSGDDLLVRALSQNQYFQVILIENVWRRGWQEIWIQAWVCIISKGQVQRYASFLDNIQCHINHCHVCLIQGPKPCAGALNQINNHSIKHV